MKSCWKGVQNERAQILPIMALLLIVFIGLMGIAIDVGRIFIARTELSRAVDAAALAGVVELPNITNAHTKAATYITQNQSDASISFPITTDQYQIKIAGQRSVPMFFMGMFGFGSVAIHANATAGYGIVPLDVAMSLDATGSMHSGCNSTETNTGGVCPIYEAKGAAKSFVNALLSGGAGSGNTIIGANAYRGCFNPPRAQAACVTNSMTTNLSSNATTLTNGITNIYAIGGPGQATSGSGTNVCLGLKKANDVIMGPGHHTAPNTLRFIVILTDGDNVYNAGVSNQTSPQSPDAPCRPSSPTTADGDLTSNCRSDTQTQEAKLDALTKAEADALKAANVEIYIVAFSVCGGIDTSLLTNPCNSIGSSGASYPDSTQDHRLLKCIATNTPGTNDHYFETATASALPGIFNRIAQAIAFRLVE